MLQLHLDGALGVVTTVRSTPTTTTTATTIVNATNTSNTCAFSLLLVLLVLVPSLFLGVRYVDTGIDLARPRPVVPRRVVSRIGIGTDIPG
jgi:hypothetical protein